MYLQASVDSSSVAPLFAPLQTTTLLLCYSFTRNRIEDICQVFFFFFQSRMLFVSGLGVGCQRPDLIYFPSLGSSVPGPSCWAVFEPCWVLTWRIFAVVATPFPLHYKFSNHDLKIGPLKRPEEFPNCSCLIVRVALFKWELSCVPCV